MDNNDFLTDWGLSLMVFLPLAGALLMMLIPKAEEQLHKVVALGRLAGLGRRRRRACSLDFDYDHADKLQFVVDKSWIEVINSRYIVGLDGLSLPLVALTLLVTPLVHHLQLEPLPRAAQPEGVPHPDPRAAHRHARHVRGPGPDPVLRLLRGRAAADVLHDRRVGRRERQYAAIKFFLFTLFGSALMIVSFLALFFVTGGETLLDGRPRPGRGRAQRGRRPSPCPPRC